jgi:RNA polymerase sigma-54 factor
MLIQRQSPTIRPLTTAHLAQTMSLLELNFDELRQKIDQELNGNPALEFVEESVCPTCHHRVNGSHHCPVCSHPNLEFPDQPIIFISSRTDFAEPHHPSIDGDTINIEWLSATDDLPTHVLQQISPELQQQDRALAAHILTSINDDGLLETPLVEIAQYQHVSLARVRQVLSLIQHAEPLGVGSTTPQEALLVQLEVLSETQHIPQLAFSLIQEEMNLLSRKALLEISRKYKIPIDEVETTCHFISENLNPYPGRTNWNGKNSLDHNPTYTQPDILVSRLSESPDSPLVVEILSPYAGNLRINPMFREALHLAPLEKTSEWQNSLESANLLVKCLQQRNQALVRLMKKLVVLQRDFLLEGDSWIKPITRAKLADELEVHESTISRAVSGKSLQLPNKKIIPLSKLFDRSLHIRSALRGFIENETTPLSDNQLVELLEKQGYVVARRTVAKYRSIEGILAARFR